MLLVLFLGLTARLLALPFAQTVEADAVVRTFLARSWMSDPHVITDAVWGPLHFYLIAASLWILEDPWLSPVVLTIFFGVLVAVPLLLFTAEEFGHRFAVFAAAAALFYPVAFRNSLMALSEVPCTTLLVLAFFWLARARRETGSVLHAMLAGTCLTLATMLRYEPWVLIPLLALLLWRRRRLLLVFVCASAAFPVFWMAASYVHHGDPLYSVHWASWWQIEVGGHNDNLTASRLAVRWLYLPTIVLWGLTPLVGLLVVLGVLRTLWLRTGREAWLIPLTGLLVVCMISAARGSMLLRARYSVLLGMLSLPFVVEGLRAVAGFLPRRTHVAAAVAVIATMLPLAHPTAQVLRRVFGSEEAGWDMAPIPRLHDVEKTTRIANLLCGLLGDQDGIVTDFLGWEETYYVLLATRAHPDRIWVAPGEARQQPELDRLQQLVTRYRQGLLLLQKGSRFAGSVPQVEAGQPVAVRQQTLRTEFLAGVDDVAIYRYRVE